MRTNAHALLNSVPKTHLRARIYIYIRQKELGLLQMVCLNYDFWSQWRKNHPPTSCQKFFKNLV